MIPDIILAYEETFYVNSTPLNHLFLLPISILSFLIIISNVSLSEMSFSDKKKVSDLSNL